MSLFVPKKRKVLVSLIFTLLIMSCFRDFRFFTGDLRLILGTKVFFFCLLQMEMYKRNTKCCTKRKQKSEMGKKEKKCYKFIFI